MSISNYCTVCQQDIESNSPRVIVTCCCHVFHTSCLRKALKYDTRCPLCRTKLSKEFPVSDLIFLRCKNPDTGHRWTIGVGKNGGTYCSFPYWIRCNRM